MIGNTVRCALVCALLFIICPYAAWSETPQTSSAGSQWTRPKIFVPSCAVPPHIDGVLDDACWKSAAHASVFFRLTSPVTEQTQAWLCADSTHLYVAFRCFDDQPKSIKASETQRNGNTWVDDYVCVDLDSQNDQHGYSQFIVTACGTQNDYIEGGTASNISWAGDWHAATRRVKHGWIAEISIPFSLLRYPPGAHSFGIMLERKLARETSSEFWPNRPQVSRTHPVEYFGDLTGLEPKFNRPQPLFLPYVIASGGEGNSVKAGMDVKYPVSPGLTAVATINPDFGTVEQSVNNIAFSYTPQYVDDQRPFFQEGSGFFPTSDIFYSSSIGNIDEGVKVTGKEGETSLAMLAIRQGGPNSQFARTLQVQRDLDAMSSVSFAYTGDNQSGLDSNQVAKGQINLGWHAGQGLWSVNMAQADSWVGPDKEGGEVYEHISYRGAPGKPGFSATYSGVAPNFVSDLGYVPQLNYKGPSFSIHQNNTFDQGWLKSYYLYGSWSTADYWTGGFFQDGAYASASIDTRPGNGYGVSMSQGRYEDYRDHVNELYGYWSDSTQFGGGGCDLQAGTQEDQKYRYWQISQGYAVSRTINASVTYVRQTLGSTLTTQLVLTPQYRLTSDRSIGGRIVSQNGQTDIFLSYAQRSRTGSDIFVLFGNPNSATTEGMITVKVTTPV